MQAQIGMLGVGTIGKAQAPPEVLQALRDIDPKVDLVKYGDGGWWMLVTSFDKGEIMNAIEARIEKVHGKLFGTGTAGLDRPSDIVEKTVLEREAAIELELLHYFRTNRVRPIERYDCGERAPGYEIVDDFRERDFNWRNRPDETFRRKQEEVSLEAADRWRTDVMRDYAESESRSLFKYVIKGVRGVLQAAAPWR